jgi:hypothetical protein
MADTTLPSDLSSCPQKENNKHLLHDALRRTQYQFWGIPSKISNPDQTHMEGYDTK